MKQEVKKLLILLQVCIDLSVHILGDPESLFDLIVVFH